MIEAPVRVPKVRTFSRCKVTGVAVLVGLLVGAAPAVAGAPAKTGKAPTAVTTSLTCHADSSRKAPVTFSPAVTLERRVTRITGTFHLTGCTSPDGSQRRLRSATVKIHGRANADCTGADGISGSSTIVWYDAASHRVGTSTGHATQRSVSSYNPGDALLSGAVDRGLLAGTRSSATTTPTSNVARCTTRGLHVLRATGTVRFWK